MTCTICKRPEYRQGLCLACYRFRNGLFDYEPTEEELEATIKEQMKCLPKWWMQDYEAMNGHPWPGEVPQEP